MRPRRPRRKWARGAVLRQARVLVRQSQRHLQTSSDDDSLLEASRRMAEVRRKLFLAVRERLGQRLALPPEEFESFLRLVRSQLKFSVPWSLKGS